MNKTEIKIIEHPSPSMRYKLTSMLVKTFGYKKVFASIEKTQKELEHAKKRNSKPYKLHHFFSLGTTCEKRKINALDYYVLNRGKDKDIIFYLHGGAYISRPMVFHWRFVDILSRKTKQMVIFPIYPLAPNFTYKKAYEELYCLYNYIKKTYPKSKISIMGDSAGGGLSLGFSCYLAQKNIKPPENCVLLSPWLDVTMKNKEIKDYVAIDPMVSPDGLPLIGHTWAGDDSPEEPMVSPINADLKNIGKLSLFVGTHEVLLPDCRLLKEKAKKAKIPLSYYEYEKMNHAFPLHPIPEANKAIEKICELIKE